MEAVKELLLKMADDELILGHRNSEWTGLGPTLEEDIAFSSMAQDKVGHSLALYKVLHEDYDMPDPDTIAFTRKENEYKCSHLAEIYTQDYAYALIRHFLFDTAIFLRYDMLTHSSIEHLASLAKKIKGEMKYHTLHADTWVRKLGPATEESNARMQSALNETYPLSLGIFEEGPYEEELASKNIFEGEKALQEKWLKTITPIIEEANLQLPEIKDSRSGHGGRNGYHTDHLQPLLKEMTEVFSTDPQTEW